MTGKQLAKILRAATGKIHAETITTDDMFYAPIEKAVLLEWVTRCGDTETGMKLSKTGTNWYFDRDWS
jgi:hypothetical protein